MHKAVMIALFVSTATVANAQDTLTSTSNSGSTANSGSISGAQSDNNSQNNNAGIGNSTSSSTSNAGAVSGSNSASESSGNIQGQSQGQSSNNEQGQSQGQSSNNEQGQGQSQSQGQEQGNAQTTNLTFNSEDRKTHEVRTNTPVGLAASSSFSSDYCGGTMSGGASAAPLGISIGAAGPKYDKSCQALRRAEKFGMAAANAQNMGQPALAQQLMSMMIWSICTSDTGGSEIEHPTAQACSAAGLLGTAQVAQNQAPAPPEARQVNNPKVADGGNATRALAQNVPPNDPRHAAAPAQAQANPH